MPRGGPHASAATTGGGELGSRRAGRLRRSRPLNEARSATVASTPGAPTRHTRHPLVATDVRGVPCSTDITGAQEPTGSAGAHVSRAPAGRWREWARSAARWTSSTPRVEPIRGRLRRPYVRDPRLVQSRGRTTRWEWRRRGAEAMRPAVKGGFHGTYSHARRGARDGTSARAAMGREATLWLRAGRHACTRG